MPDLVPGIMEACKAFADDAVDGQSWVYDLCSDDAHCILFAARQRSCEIARLARPVPSRLA